MRRAVCPHCREPADPKTDAACPHCRRTLRSAEGHVIRAIDVDFESQVAALDARAWASTWKGAVAAGIAWLSLFVPLLQVLSWPLVPPLLVIGQLVWIRIGIAGPYRRHFGTTRRIVTRWLSRLLLASAATVHVALLPVPLGNPLWFGALCAAAWGYFRWHFHRERERKPVAWFESILIGVAVIVFLTTLALFVLLVWGISALSTLFSGG